MQFIIFAAVLWAIFSPNLRGGGSSRGSEAAPNNHLNKDYFCRYFTATCLFLSAFRRRWRSSAAVRAPALPGCLYNGASPQLNLTHLVHRLRRAPGGSLRVPVEPSWMAGETHTEGEHKSVPTRLLPETACAPKATSFSASITANVVAFCFCVWLLFEHNRRRAAV